MFLSEPPRTAYDLHFSVLGIPVRVHPMFWAVSVLFGLSGNRQLPEMLLWVGAVFVSILVHELGHALTARSFGWEPHITLHGFGGLASYQPTYRSPASQILITAAGPGAGFAFALFIWTLLAAGGRHPQIDFNGGWMPSVDWELFRSTRLNLLVLYLLFINIFWGLVNLLPVLPLDGGNIAREVLGLMDPRDALRQSLWLSVACAAIVAILAFTRLHDPYLGIFFGYLAYNSFASLQALIGPGGGLGGFR